MEIEGTDCSKTLLKSNSKLEWGRGSGFQIDDRTVSRRQLELEQDEVAGEPKLRFQVLGRNPVWVHRRKTGEVSTFKSSDTGGMEIGDAFCVSAKNPIWFTCKKRELGGEKRKSEKIELGLEVELDELKEFGSFDIQSVDVADIDPVKEFGFLVIGEEFNGYPKSMIKDMKNWDWFLEEPREKGSDDDEDGERKRKSGGRRKRKKGEEKEDEDWTGESEEDKDLITRATKVLKPKYSTRSKNKKGGVSKNAGKKTKSPGANVSGDEEDDETLGGFIVDDENLEKDEETDEEEGEELDEEEEEEFDEEEFDD